MDHIKRNDIIADFKKSLYGKLTPAQSSDNTTERKESTKEWFCNTDIGDQEEVEIIVQGTEDKPDEAFVEMADRILKQLPNHLNRALSYLKEFFPRQDIEEYVLSTITFGQFLNFNEMNVEGFTFVFIYGRYPDAFQFKVKLNDGGWPIGFEGGPL